MTGMSRHLTMTIAPEKAEDFLSHSKPTPDTVTAEPDCNHYTYFEVVQDPEQRGTFNSSKFGVESKLGLGM